MTLLRQRLIDELDLRGLATNTKRNYVYWVHQLAKYYHRSPDQITDQEIRKDSPGITRKQFMYNLSRSSYEKAWGATYRKPTVWSRMLATVAKYVLLHTLIGS